MPYKQHRKRTACSNCGGPISAADAMLRIGWCKACRATNPMWRGDQKDVIYGYKRARAGTAESWWAKPGLSW